MQDNRSLRAPTLIQNSSGAWYARFRLEGISLPLGVRTPKRPRTQPPDSEVRSRWIQVGRYHYPKHIYDRFQAEFVVPYLQGQFIPTRLPKGVAVQDAIERFLARDGLTESTRRSYSSVLSLFRDSLVDRRMLLRELRQEDIDGFIGRPQLESPSSRASYARQLNAFLNWARRKSLLEGDGLVAHVRHNGTGRLGRRLFLSPAEYKRVRASISETGDALPAFRKKRGQVSWAIDLFDFALSTGLRLDELVHLQWQDIRPERGTIEVRPKTKSRDGFDFMPKGKRARFVEIQPLAQAVLERPRVIGRRLGALARVFQAPTSSPQADTPFNPNRASKIWRRHRDLASVSDPVPLHGLRHMFVTYSLILGWETFYVQAFAGHASVTTTEGYAQFTRQLCSRKERDRLIGEIVDLGFARP